MGSKRDKIKNSDATEKQQQRRALSITERRRCEKEYEEQEAMKTRYRLLKIAQRGEQIEGIVIGPEGGEQQRAEKRRMKIVFSCQMLLSHDYVRQRNVTLAGNTIK